MNHTNTTWNDLIEAHCTRHTDPHRFEHLRFLQLQMPCRLAIIRDHVADQSPVCFGLMGNLLYDLPPEDLVTLLPELLERMTFEVLTHHDVWTRNLILSIPRHLLAERIDSVVAQALMRGDDDDRGVILALCREIAPATYARHDSVAQ